MSRKPTILVLEALSGSGRCVKRAGGEPDCVSPRSLSAADEVLTAGVFDGLLLTGGGDVDPRLYGQKPHKRTYGVSEDRDNIELYALLRAYELGVPVLGICRGAQLINVEAGGTLKQHIGGHRGIEHRVIMMDRGRGRSKLCRPSVAVPREFRCVSYHHQRIEKVAPGFRITGRGLDGCPEVIESRDGRVVGVQFHPEMDPRALYARNVFRWLIIEAAQRAGIPVPPVPRQSTHTSTRRQSTPTLGLAPREPRREVVVDPKLQTSSQNRHCPHCGIWFMNLKDREDHVRVLHRKEASNAI